MFDLQRFRKEKNISQKAFAALFNVSQAFISQLESGNTAFPVEFLEKIKAAYPDDNLSGYITNIDEVKAGNIRERLKKYILYLGISENVFCESIGVSPNYVNSIRGGIPPEKLRAISDVYPELNPVWLISGSGEMVLKEKPDTSYSPLFKIIESQQRTIENLSATIAKLTNK